MRTLLLLSLLLLAIPGHGAAQADLQAFLIDSLGMDDGKVKDLFDGDVVVQTLDGDDAIEIATAGAFILPLPADEVMARLMELARSGAGAGIQSVAPLSQPPARSELDVLPLSEDDLKELRECRVGECKVKLPDDALQEFTSFDWDAPGTEERAVQMLRNRMHEYALAYLEGGNSALAVYHDKEEPAALHDGLVVLFDESPYLFEFAPEFREHILNYPETSLNNATDDLMWTVQDLGIRPITALTHLTTQRRSDPNGLSGLISAKQLYASHYFLAALGITAVLSVDTAAGPGTVVLQIDRYRFDDRLGRIQRRAVRGKLSGFVEDALKARRTALGG